MVRKGLILVIFLSCLNCIEKGNNEPLDTKLKENSENIVNSIEEADDIKTQGILVFKTQKKNLGNIKRNAVIQEEFIAVNSGKETVEIVAYQASCNCTDLIIENSIIKANDSTNITMTVETNDKTLGNHTITTTLKTNGQRKFYLLTTDFTLEE